MDGLVFGFHFPCCSALHSLTKGVSRNDYPSDDIKFSHQITEAIRVYFATNKLA
jgi:hypothetical protein